MAVVVMRCQARRRPPGVIVVVGAEPTAQDEQGREARARTLQSPRMPQLGLMGSNVPRSFVCSFVNRTGELREDGLRVSW